MKKYIPSFLSACLIVVFAVFTAEEAFSQSNGTSSVPTGITAGRAWALAGALFGLISLIVGWRAKVRSANGASSGRSWSVTGLVLGFICIILSLVHLATTNGGFGTGGGKAGAIVALVLGLIGISFSGMALRTKWR
jgi:hypothetical protein